MRARLSLVYRRFAKQTALLEQAMVSPRRIRVQESDGLNRQLIDEMCVIRLQDSWARFCRDLVVLSCWAERITIGGKRVARAPGILRARDVIPALISTYPKRKKEPDWHIPEECLRAARQLQIANYATVQSGLGMSFPHSPTDQVRHLRNYFAHRNVTTAQRVQELAIDMGFTSATLPHLLVGSVLQTGISVFSLWVLRLRTMAQVAIQ